jgi:hypothetical protein
MGAEMGGGKKAKSFFEVLEKNIYLRSQKRLCQKQPRQTRENYFHPC